MNALDAIRGGLVVSCQAYPGEPLRTTAAMTAMALSALAGGAVGIRAQGLDDIAAIRAVTTLPLIGLVKDGDTGVYITPTPARARAVAAAGADIVAVDGTRRPRPDGSTLADAVAAVHAEGALVLADCGSLADAEAAVRAGADAVATTLAGYTGERARTVGPDLALVVELLAAVTVPVVVEGRVHTPDQARHAADAGAWAVVVGTAITHPTTVTGWFAAALAGTRTRS